MRTTWRSGTTVTSAGRVPEEQLDVNGPSVWQHQRTTTKDDTLDGSEFQDELPATAASVPGRRWQRRAQLHLVEHAARGYRNDHAFGHAARRTASHRLRATPPWSHNQATTSSTVTGRSPRGLQVECTGIWAAIPRQKNIGL
ncbi:MAG: hypothetical protein H6594_10225 [Flavobacteriales bacterium]|nr:hypothetical protein [Flavobacteriales bacterium]